MCSLTLSMNNNIIHAFANTIHFVHFMLRYMVHLTLEGVLVLVSACFVWVVLADLLPCCVSLKSFLVSEGLWISAVLSRPPSMDPSSLSGTHSTYLTSFSVTLFTSVQCDWIPLSKSSLKVSSQAWSDASCWSTEEHELRSSTEASCADICSSSEMVSPLAVSNSETGSMTRLEVSLTFLRGGRFSDASTWSESFVISGVWSRDWFNFGDKRAEAWPEI